MSTLLPVFIGLGFTLVGVAIGKLWQMAVEFTTIRAQLVKAKQDNDNLGDMVRQTQLKLFYAATMLSSDANRQEILNALVRRLT